MLEMVLTIYRRIKSACGYIEKLAEKMNPSVQKLGSRGIFQHESKPKKKEFSKEAKVTTVSWLSMFYLPKKGRIPTV